MRRIAFWLPLLLVFTTNALWSGGELSEDPIEKLLQLHGQVMQASSDSEALLAHEALKEAMRSVWSTHDFWSSDWQTLSQHMGVVSAGSGDKRVALITWNIELQNRTQAYGGFALAFDRSGKAVTIELNHHPQSLHRQKLDSKKRFKADDWPGAVYYEIIEQEQGNNLVFTLLGWDGADGIRSRKVIETLSFHHGKLRFGVPILDLGRGSEKRLILEHADAVTAMLRWREDLSMIVMDHLSAPESQMNGNTAFYGPDMTYDALVWQKNHWVLKEDVEIRDPDMKKPWNNPKRLRRRH
tara:strand:+ start:632 stop:1522 length:891 start_codon:yes stop_codon:yes gene_type:complete